MKREQGIAVELDFDDGKLLVPGVHDVTMEQVKEHFGKFQKSDRRITLFAKLQTLVEAGERPRAAAA